MILYKEPQIEQMKKDFSAYSQTIRVSMEGFSV